MLVPPDQRGRAIALVFGGFTVATVLGLPLGTLLGAAIGWRAALAVLGIVALAAPVILWRVLPADLFTKTIMRADWARLLGSRAILLALALTLAFPGAVGWAATTPGGRGGKIIRVTTLAPDGPGSFKAAIEEKGPRIVVFEVGGVIDMGRKEISIREPFITIAGQTAPSPGITLIKTGMNVRTHDVIVRHIRIRSGADGQPKRSGWEPDAFGTVSAFLLSTSRVRNLRFLKTTGITGSLGAGPN